MTGQILVESGDGAYTYRFSHDHIREIVYTETGYARRTAFHRRALRHLEGGVYPAAELAHHALVARE